MKKLSSKEMRGLVQFNSKYENYLLMPNELIGKLVECEELKDGKAIAVAYSYVYLNTWLYRYAKYGAMSFEETSVKSIKTMLGLSPTNGTYDYIIKKGGVLGKLGVTETLSMTESPINVWVDREDDFSSPTFTLFNELEDESKKIILKGQTMKRKTFKKPLMALGSREVMETEYDGTYFEGGKEHTHMIPFEVFIKCMTNSELGVVGFYLYSFLQSRIGAKANVGISLEGITKYSGIKRTVRDEHLRELKAFNLIGSNPEDFCLERGEFKTESSKYWTNPNPAKWNATPNYDFKTRKVYHVSTHIQNISAKAEAIFKRDE